MKDTERAFGQRELFDEAEVDQEDADLERIMHDLELNLVQEPSQVTLTGPNGDQFTAGEYLDVGDGDPALAFYRMFAMSADPEIDSWNEGAEIIH